MKSIKIFIVFIALGSLMMSMAMYKTKEERIIVNAKDSVWADSVWKGTTLADLKTGQDLYNNHCNVCHKFHYPNELTADKWQKIIPNMAKKSELAEQQGNLVLKFVITAGRSGRPLP